METIQELEKSFTIIKYRYSHEKMKIIFIMKTVRKL